MFVLLWVISPVGLWVCYGRAVMLLVCLFLCSFIYLYIGRGSYEFVVRKLREIWSVFEGLFHSAWVCHIIRGFCLVVESRHLLLVCVDKCWLWVIYFEHVGSWKEFCRSVYCLMESLGIEVAVLRLLSRVFFCFSQINSWSVVVLLKPSLSHCFF